MVEDSGVRVRIPFSAPSCRDSLMVEHMSVNGAVSLNVLVSKDDGMVTPNHANLDRIW